MNNATARYVGKLSYNPSISLFDEVTTCSITNLINQHLSGTGPKIINQFELAFGKIWFIKSSFHKGAIGEILIR
jgi:hypothetical protein